jgi:hypothetical protein
LYVAALDLPDVTDEMQESYLGLAVRLERSKVEAVSELHEIFGQHNIYWRMFDPFQKSKPHLSTLSENLLNIYWGLENGLSTLRGESEGHFWAAAYNWRAGFYFEWGTYLISALWAVHWLITNYGDA